MTIWEDEKRIVKRNGKKKTQVGSNMIYFLKKKERKTTQAEISTTSTSNKTLINADSKKKRNRLNV